MNTQNVFCIDTDDHIIDAFAEGSGATLLSKSDFSKKERNSKEIIILRGLKNRSVLWKLMENKKDFYYIDSGYLGNTEGKMWHRIIKNNFHSTEYLNSYPEDRLLTIFPKESNSNFIYHKLLKPWNKEKQNILLCPPTTKTAKFFKLEEPKLWTNSVITEIKKYSNQPILLREKPASSRDRKNIYEYLKENEISVVVTFNSNIAVESIMAGVPVVTLGPNAAAHVGRTKISDINNLIYPDRKNWLKYLSYNQFTKQEIKSGVAWRILNEQNR